MRIATRIATSKSDSSNQIAARRNDSRMPRGAISLMSSFHGTPLWLLGLWLCVTLSFKRSASDDGHQLPVRVRRTWNDSRHASRMGVPSSSPPPPFARTRCSAPWALRDLLWVKFRSLQLCRVITPHKHSSKGPRHVRHSPNAMQSPRCLIIPTCGSQRLLYWITTYHQSLTLLLVAYTLLLT
jgi:hypothetical protein